METKKRRIDANTLIERFSGGDAMKSMSESLHDSIFVEELRNAPTVDAVEVVRCKDCRHCKYQDEDDDRGDYDIHDTWTTRTPESFCSYGERRPDDH